MTFEMYLAFVAATTALVAIPGPNVALITANSIAHGRRMGLVTVAGTSTAMVPQLAFTVMGLTGVLTLAANLFEYLRWLGVAYLIYLAVQAWRAPPVDLTKIKPLAESAWVVFRRGFVVSLTNPKTLLFYGAFFPQFVSSHDVGIQLAILSATFLLIAATLDCGWALLAERLRGLLATNGRIRNRLTGSFYFAAAVGLAAAKRPS